MACSENLTAPSNASLLRILENIVETQQALASDVDKVEMGEKQEEADRLMEIIRHLLPKEAPKTAEPPILRQVINAGALPQAAPTTEAPAAVVASKPPMSTIPAPSGPFVGPVKMAIPKPLEVRKKWTTKPAVPAAPAKPSISPAPPNAADTTPATKAADTDESKRSADSSAATSSKSSLFGSFPCRSQSIFGAPSPPSAPIFGGAKPVAGGKTSNPANFFKSVTGTLPVKNNGKSLFHGGESTSRPSTFAQAASTIKFVFCDESYEKAMERLVQRKRKSPFGIGNNGNGDASEGRAPPAKTPSPKAIESGSVAGGNAFDQAADAAFIDGAYRRNKEKITNQKRNLFGGGEKAAGDASAEASDESEGEEENTEEYESDAVFKSVVPLPKLVETMTGEENETVVFTHRCRLTQLFSEKKEWKERGTGELKILQNPATKISRVVMRREKTQSLCANFPIIPTITIHQKPDNHKVYQFVCSDFSDSAQGSIVMFGIRFGREETARQFRDRFLEVQKEWKLPIRLEAPDCL